MTAEPQEWYETERLADQVTQPLQALELAQEARLEAARLRASIRAGGRTGGAERAARAVLAGTSPMPFYRLLRAVPRVGKTRADRMCAIARINPQARVDAKLVDARRRELLAGELYVHGSPR